MRKVYPSMYLYFLPRFCRGTAYNNQTHECDKKYSLIRPTEERKQNLIAICESRKPLKGYYPYNPSKQQCCGDVLIGPGETCCEGVRFLTPGTALGEGECCGDVGFNPNTHMCCADILYKITSEGKDLSLPLAMFFFFSNGGGG